MSHHQLFTQVEPNPVAMVAIVTYQARDHELVTTLESEIRNIIKDGEARKIFIDDTEGLWFGGVNNPKYGRRTFDSTNANKEDIAYSSHINKLCHPRPKNEYYISQNGEVASPSFPSMTLLQKKHHHPLFPSLVQPSLYHLLMPLIITLK